jgi:hypothetical protein
MFVTKQLEKLYVQVLEKALVERAIELDVSTSQELMTRSVLLTLPLREHSTPEAQSSIPVEPGVRERQATFTDPVLQRLADLRSGNADLVRRTLSSVDHLDAIFVPQVIVLVAWDEIAPDAMRVLRAGVGQIVGQLLDGLLDKDADFAIRRRIPRVLAHSDDPRAVQGLIRGLDDSRFEVRFQCARALDAILQRKPEYRPEPNTIFAIIEREVSVSPEIWESRRLLDRRQSADQLLFLDNVLRERAKLSWEHLFSLLALILPREPLKVAFQALHTDDRLLRGLALEYLCSVLPPSLRNVQTILENGGVATPGATIPEEVAARLMDARQTITLRLARSAKTPGE